jgi:pimeloyl-ACP methyl ester carboxylesterase
MDSIVKTGQAIFKPSIQPYMISWIKYDPQIEIKKLTIPVLILQGTNDFQVSVDDAKLLQNADPKAHMVLINNMNHVFRIFEGDRVANLKTYSDPTLPISVELTKNITDFILRN